jgi:hypothetical protein
MQLVSRKCRRTFPICICHLWIHHRSWWESWFSDFSFLLAIHRYMPSQNRTTQWSILQGATLAIGYKWSGSDNYIQVMGLIMAALDSLSQIFKCNVVCYWQLQQQKWCKNLWEDVDMLAVSITMKKIKIITLLEVLLRGVSGWINLPIMSGMR